jgi:hypothetical protein
MQLSTSSGLVVFTDTATGSFPIFTTSFKTVAAGTAGFYVDVNAHAARLVKMDVAVIVQSSNVSAAGRVCAISWSYNSGTGRARIAFNGILTSATSVQTLSHGTCNNLGYYTDNALATAPGNLALFALSPDECLSDQALIEASIPSQAWGALFAPQTRNIFVSVAGGGDVTLTPSLFTDADTFYVPTVAPGSVGLTSSLFTNTNTFYAPVVASSASLIPSLFADSDTFYAATVTAGGALFPAVYVDADTFYSPAVTPGAVNLTPSLFTDADTFYTAVVAATGALGDIYNAVGYFATGGTVTISLYDPITGTAISLGSSACPEIGTTGVYIWNSTKLSAQPTGYQEYAYKMSNGTTFSGGVMIMAITAQAIATAVWAETLDVITAEQTMKVVLAALAGKRAGIGTATERYYDSAVTTAVVTFAPDARGNGIPTVTP